jgi:uncharacterized protein YcfL
MTTKLLLISISLLLFSACSEKAYEDMYRNQTNIFDSYPNLQVENDNRTLQNGENPMKRPSYDEYRQR